MKRYTRKIKLTIDKVEKVLKPVVIENLDQNKGKLQVEIAGEKIYALSDRYKTFFVKGYECVNCGLKGSFFALERNRDVIHNGTRYHLNLYAINEYGEEVLMTKDHILPKSKGGKNHLDNYQTMCINCNNKKGNTIVDH